MSAPWEDRRALEDLLRVLRGYGVRRFEAGEMSVEFEGPPPAAVPETPDVPKDLGTTEKLCACGHPELAHNNNGLCIAGACPYTVCHPEATPKPG